MALGGCAEIQVELRYALEPVDAKDKHAPPYFDRMTAVAARVVAPTARCAKCAASAPASPPAPAARPMRTASASGSTAPANGATRSWCRPQPGALPPAVTAALLCTDGAAAPAMVGIDRDDRRFFSDARGAWFYPLGENVAWAGDYAPYLDAIAAAGGNWLRTWICPWNNPLDGPGAGAVVASTSPRRAISIGSSPSRSSTAPRCSWCSITTACSAATGAKSP